MYVKRGKSGMGGLGNKIGVTQTRGVRRLQGDRYVVRHGHVDVLGVTQRSHGANGGTADKDAEHCGEDSLGYATKFLGLSRDRECCDWRSWRLILVEGLIRTSPLLLRRMECLRGYSVPSPSRYVVDSESNSQ